MPYLAFFTKYLCALNNKKKNWYDSKGPKRGPLKMFAYKSPAL